MANFLNLVHGGIIAKKPGFFYTKDRSSFCHSAVRSTTKTRLNTMSAASESRFGERLSIAALVILPFVGFIAGIYYAWINHGISWLDLGLLIFFYVLTGMGITVGFHRHFTHESFKAKPWLRYFLGVAGSMAFQGTLWEWCVRHHHHHIYSDQEEDDHSPYHYGRGFWNMTKGLLHAQVLWLFKANAPEQGTQFGKKLAEDPVCASVTRHTLLWMVLSASLPGIIGLVITQSWAGAWSALLWGGLVRLFLLQHVTWSVNSWAHVFGKRIFESGDQSRDSKFVAFFAFGEGWHNGHHAFPRSVLHGIDKRWADVSYLTIRLFEKLGWAWDLYLPRPELVERKRIVPS